MWVPLERMMNRWQIFVTTALLLFQGCKSKNADLEFEQHVFNQVWIQVTDSTYRDKRIYTFPCEKSTGIIDTGDLFEFDNPECNRQLALLRKDTTGLVLAVQDSVQYIAQEDQKYFSGPFKMLDSRRYSIDIGSNKKRKFVFRYKSELEPDMEFQNWASKYPKFGGAMSYSKIYFDLKRANGVMEVSYHCGSKCGLGYLVYITKVKGKWRVKQVVDTWIS